MVIGGIGSGKSCLCYGILEYLHYFRPEIPIYVYGFPMENQDCLPGWINVCRTPNLPEKSIVLTDEAYILWHSRSSMSKTSRLMDKFAGLVRQKDILGIFVTQSLRKLDIGILSSAQLVLIKRVPYLQVQLDRYQLRPKLAEINKHFAKAREIGYNIQQCTYAICNTHDWEGMIQDSNFPPSFWCEELSKSWAGVKLTDGEE